MNLYHVTKIPAVFVFFFVTAVLSEIVRSICFVAYSRGSTCRLLIRECTSSFCIFAFFLLVGPPEENRRLASLRYGISFLFFIFNGAMPRVV